MGRRADGREVRGALEGLASGDASAADRLFPLVYGELRRLAAALLKRERSDHTLQPTALVHEAWIRLADEPESAWTDVAHFKAVAVRAMRRILTDHARAHAAAKRGGQWRRVTLADPSGAGAEQAVELLALDEALDHLASLHERQARVAELRFLGGLTVQETAHVLGVDASTVKADWAMARVTLARLLGQGFSNRDGSP